MALIQDDSPYPVRDKKTFSLVSFLFLFLRFKDFAAFASTTWNKKKGYFKPFFLIAVIIASYFLGTEEILCSKLGKMNTSSPEYRPNEFSTLGLHKLRNAFHDAARLGHLGTLILQDDGTALNTSSQINPERLRVREDTTQAFFYTFQDYSPLPEKNIYIAIPIKGLIYDNPDLKPIFTMVREINLSLEDTPTADETPSSEGELARLLAQAGDESQDTPTPLPVITPSHTQSAPTKSTIDGNRIR